MIHSCLVCVNLSIAYPLAIDSSYQNRHLRHTSPTSDRFTPIQYLGFLQWTWSIYYYCFIAIRFIVVYIVSLNIFCLEFILSSFMYIIYCVYIYIYTSLLSLGSTMTNNLYLWYIYILYLYIYMWINTLSLYIYYIYTIYVYIYIYIQYI